MSGSLEESAPLVDAPASLTDARRPFCSTTLLSKLRTTALATAHAGFAA